VKPLRKQQALKIGLELKEGGKKKAPKKAFLMQKLGVIYKTWGSFKDM